MQNSKTSKRRLPDTAAKPEWCGCESASRALHAAGNLVGNLADYADLEEKCQP